MSNTLKNIIEVSEAEGEYGSALETRSQNIANFSILGPPELVYLTKELRKAIGGSKNPPKHGFYHYCYGVDLSTAAAMSFYVSSLLKEQEELTGWFKNGKWVITKAVFCVYDAFRRLDVRGEYSFPGGMKLYAINRDGESIAVDDSQWESVYISSTLRAFNPIPAPACKFYKELPTQEQLQYFLDVVQIYSSTKDLPMENSELLQFRGNRILYHVSDYLIKKRRVKHALSFFSELSKTDPRCAGFLSDVFASIYKYPQSVKMLAPILEKNPHMAVLLYQEADCMMKAEKFETALKIAKFAIQLCPDSQEAWILLAEIYFYSKNYKHALLALNMCPLYAKSTYNNGLEEDKMLKLTKPKLNNQINNFTKHMFEPSSDIYKITQFQEEFASSAPELLEENEKIIKMIKSLPGGRLEDNEAKLYKVLVKLEREIGWDSLLKIRSKLFLMENDLVTKSKKPIDKPPVEQSQMEDYSIYEPSIYIDNPNTNFIPGVQMNEQSFFQVKAGGDNIIDMYIEEVDSEESVEEADMPGFLRLNNETDVSSMGVLGRDDETIDPNAQKSGSKQNQKGDEQKFEGENYKDIQTREKFNPENIIGFGTRRKRLCSRTLDSLFVALYQDLNVLFEWQHEENDGNILSNSKDKKKHEDKYSYTGLTWVHRGILAERLCRLRLSEQAYRKAIDTGHSIYSWSRLFKLYIEVGNPKAAIIALAEILDDIESEGVTKFVKLPGWIEEPIMNLIGNIGLRRYKELLKEMNWQDDAMKRLLEEVEYWGIEGAAN